MPVQASLPRHCPTASLGVLSAPTRARTSTTLKELCKQMQLRSPRLVGGSGEELLLQLVSQTMCFTVLAVLAPVVRADGACVA